MRLGGLVCCVLLACGVTAAQEQKTETKPQPVPPHVRPVDPAARLRAAKTVLVRNAVGSEIPYNVISSAIESWGRYTLVNSPEKADIIVEVSAPGTGSGVSVSSSVNRPGSAGRHEQTTTSSRELSNAPVRIIVYDARSHIALWSATEQPHFAMKQKAKEDSLVEAAQKLVSKFRDRVEPQ